MGGIVFTVKSLRALQPRKTTYRVFEKSVDKGFCVQVTPAGGIYFYLQYQSPVTGRRRFLPLGRYPTVSLAKAREKPRAARLEITVHCLYLDDFVRHDNGQRTHEECVLMMRRQTESTSTTTRLSPISPSAGQTHSNSDCVPGAATS